MSDIDELVAWLRAQVDEDERIALEIPEELRAGGSLAVWASDEYPHIEMTAGRLLREVEAKRRLLRQFELRGNSVRGIVAPSSGGVWDDLLRMLAMAYADRPGYRGEWRP